MDLKKVKIDIGIEKPIKLLHVTDNHMAYADERDSEKVQELAKKRSWAFENDTGKCIKYLDEVIAYSEAYCDLLIHTGDLIDFVSHKNLELAKEKLDGVNHYFVVGNHEFCRYVGDLDEDEAYKMKSLPMIQPYFDYDLLFSSKIIGGLNLVGIDNTYYRFNKKQIEQLEAEVEKGYPIILMMHNPLYTEELYDYLINDLKKDSSFTVGCPKERMKFYREYRYNQQLPDKETLEMIDYIYSQKLIKAIIAGHIHFTYECALPNGVVQYMTGCGAYGYATELTIV